MFHRLCFMSVNEKFKLFVVKNLKPDLPPFAGRKNIRVYPSIFTKII